MSNRSRSESWNACIDKAVADIQRGQSLNAVGLCPDQKRLFLDHLRQELARARVRVEHCPVTAFTQLFLRRPQLLEWLPRRNNTVLFIGDLSSVRVHTNCHEIEHALWRVAQQRPIVFSSLPRDVKPGKHRTASMLQDSSIVFVPHAGEELPQVDPASLAVRHVSQLSSAQMVRLARIIDPSKSPSEWRSEWGGYSDDMLSPVVVRRRTASKDYATLAESLDSSHYRPLLYQSPWPDQDPDAAGRRFRARCGNEPEPIWVDNYLTNMKTATPAKVIRFLSRVLLDDPSTAPRKLTIYSMHKSGSLIAEAYRDAGAPPELLSRVTWWLIPGRKVDMHARRLVLPHRQEQIAVPPADRAVGARPIGLEHDAEDPVCNYLEKSWPESEQVEWLHPSDSRPSPIRAA